MRPFIEFSCSSARRKLLRFRHEPKDSARRSFGDRGSAALGPLPTPPKPAGNDAARRSFCRNCRLRGGTVVWPPPGNFPVAQVAQKALNQLPCYEVSEVFVEEWARSLTSRGCSVCPVLGVLFGRGIPRTLVSRQLLLANVYKFWRTCWPLRVCIKRALPGQAARI